MIPKNDLLVQENPLCRLTLRKPTLRLVDVKTGSSETWRPRRPGSHFFLLDGREPIAPGEYELSAVGEDGAETAPQRIRINPATPKNLMLASARGGVTYGVWVNLASDPPTIVRSRFDLYAGGGVGETLPIAPASLRAKPAISEGEDPWIAWIDGSTLRYAHGTKLDETKLPAANARIIPPLPPGAARVWMDGNLCTIRLSRGGGIESKSPLPDPPPVSKDAVSVCRVKATLQRDESGAWSLFTRGRRTPLPKDIAKSTLPIELAFLGKAEPLLVCAVERLGFRILHLDGSPL